MLIYTRGLDGWTKSRSRYLPVAIAIISWLSRYIGTVFKYCNVQYAYLMEQYRGIYDKRCNDDRWCTTVLSYLESNTKYLENTF